MVVVFVLMVAADAAYRSCEEQQRMIYRVLWDDGIVSYE
jgi:hypothetical protein